MIDEIGLDSTSRLGEIQAKVMCCQSEGRSQHLNSITKISSSSDTGRNPRQTGCHYFRESCSALLVR